QQRCSGRAGVARPASSSELDGNSRQHVPRVDLVLRQPTLVPAVETQGLVVDVLELDERGDLVREGVARLEVELSVGRHVQILLGAVPELIEVLASIRVGEAQLQAVQLVEL